VGFDIFNGLKSLLIITLYSEPKEPYELKLVEAFVYLKWKLGFGIFLRALFIHHEFEILEIIPVTH